MSPTTTGIAPSPQGLKRGKPSYGVDIGIMLLDADFPRPVGDIAHGGTFDFPVHYEVTENAPVPHVVERSAEGLLPDFIASGRRLIRRGARALATSCGFLAIFQRQLSDELRVPILTSSLLQIPLALMTLPTDAKLCVVTVNASTLTDAHYVGAGITASDRERLIVVGLEETAHFYPVVVGDEGPLYPEIAQQEVLDACLAAIEIDASIAGFVFECTNLPPYAEQVRSVTGLPVWDAIVMVNWLQSAMSSPFSRI